MSTVAQPTSTPVARAAGRDVATSAVAATGAVPWYLYAVALAATCVAVGIIWDIAWHMTIGRDTFWTPAHLCTYAAGLIVGATCGWVALHTTFAGSDAERAASVRFWGFRAPLGAWIAVWGAFAMLTSAPFDDWWHNAYGLDVKIMSPPHTLLAVGMAAIVVGAMVWALAWQNRTQDAAQRRRLEWLFVYSGGMLLNMVAIFIYEYTPRGWHHSSIFYRVTAMAFPVVLVALARGSTMRWPATAAALVYMATRILMGWILPLFAATPKLGPIFNPLTHMATMEFPLLLVAPALAIDLVMQRAGKDARPARDWATAPLYALAFVAAFVAVQWPWADFLHSPAARNWLVFADRNFTYSDRPAGWYRNYRFFTGAAQDDHGLAAFWRGMALAVLWAACSTRLGLAWGRWMTRVRR